MRGIGVAAVALMAASRTVHAQQPDSTRRAVPTTTAKSLDSIKTPLGGRRAFLYSFLLPGSAQTILGRHRAAAGFLFVEAISLVMIRESAADVHEARRSANDSVVVSYVDESGARSVTKGAPRFGDPEVHTRLAHVEDWVALLVGNHLISAADAFVAANLWDVPIRLGMHSTPDPARPGDRRLALVATLTWP